MNKMSEQNLQAKWEQAVRDRDKINEEVKRLEKEIKEGNIPEHIFVGQVYKVVTPSKMGASCGRSNEYLYMVATMSSGSPNEGLTVVGRSAGCHTHDLSNGCHYQEKLREILIENDAVYLGKFNEVFAERIRP
jgi:hypothetical protein